MSLGECKRGAISVDRLQAAVRCDGQLAVRCPRPTPASCLLDSTCWLASSALSGCRGCASSQPGSSWPVARESSGSTIIAGRGFWISPTRLARSSMDHDTSVKPAGQIVYSSAVVPVASRGSHGGTRGPCRECAQRGVGRIGTGPRGRKVMPAVSAGTSTSWLQSWKRCSRTATAITASSIANCDPMQARGPAPNGK